MSTKARLIANLASGSTLTDVIIANAPTANSTTAGAVKVIDSVSNSSSTVAASANTAKRIYDYAAPKVNPSFTGTVVLPAVSANGTTGSDGQVLASNGSGTYWTSSAGGGSLTIAQSNATSNVETYTEITTLQFDEDSGFDVTNPEPGVARVAMNSTFKYWNIDGTEAIVASGLDTVDFITGDNISITANATAKSMTIAVSGTVLSANNAEYLGGQHSSYYAVSTAPGAAYANAVAHADLVAGAAYANAVSTAATDASTKAATAYSNAVAFAANASNITTGTIGTARLGSGTANSTTVLYGNGVWAAVTGGGGSIDTNAQYTWSNTSSYTTVLYANNFHPTKIFDVDTDSGQYMDVLTNTGNGIRWANTFDVHSITVHGTTTLAEVRANGTVGSNGQVLTSNGNTVYWSTISASGGGGFANGDSISVATLAVTGALTANGGNGTAGQVLSSNGTSVYWANAGVSNTYASSTFAPKASPTFTGTVTLPRVSANGSSGTAGQVLTSNGTGTYWSTVSAGGGGGGGGADLSAVAQDIIPATSSSYNIGSDANAFNNLYINGDLHAGNNVVIKQHTVLIGTVVNKIDTAEVSSTLTIDSTLAAASNLANIYFAYPYDGNSPVHYFQFLNDADASAFFSNVLGSATSFDNVTFNLDNAGGNNSLTPWIVNIRNISVQNNIILFSINYLTDIVSPAGMWIPDWWAYYDFNPNSYYQTTSAIITTITSPASYELVLDGPATAIGAGGTVLVDGAAVNATPYSSANATGNSYINTLPWTRPSPDAGSLPANAAVYFSFDQKTGNNYVQLGSTTLTTYSSNNISGVPTATGLGGVGKCLVATSGSNTSWVYWQNESSLNVGTQPFTVEMWLKDNNDNAWGAGPFFQGVNDSIYMRSSKSQTDGKVWLYTNGNLIQSAQSIADGQWHHVAAVSDGVDLRLYIDGSLSNTYVNVMPNVDMSSAEIGAAYQSENYPYQAYNGCVDDFTLTLSAKYTSNFTPFNNMANVEVGSTISYVAGSSEVVFNNADNTANSRITYTNTNNTITIDKANIGSGALASVTITNSTISNTTIGTDAIRANSFFDQLRTNVIYTPHIDSTDGFANFGRLQLYSNAQVTNATSTYAAISIYNGGLYANGNIATDNSITAKKDIDIGSGKLKTAASALQLSGFSSYSYYMNNSSWRLPTNTALDFGTGDFTIEFWMKADTSQPTYSMIMDAAGNNAGTGLGVGANDGGTLGKLTFRIASGYYIKSSTTVLDNQWHHIACVRQGSNGYIFIDGVLDVSTTSWGSRSGTLSGGSITGSSYGSGTSGDNFFRGYMTNVRVVKGTAVYTANFTPPTSALTAISGTQLLIMQNSSIQDNSPNAFTLTKLRSVDPVIASVSLGSGVSGVTTSGIFVDGSGALRATPIASKANTYTITSLDTGTVISTANGVTVPSTLLVGTHVRVFNSSSSNITITQGSGATVYVAGTSTTGDVTLAQHGLVDITCVSNGTFVAAGSGII